MNLSAPIYRLKRQAKQLARETSRPMNETLDQIASDEGFRSWSHLSSVASQQPVAKRLLNGFQPRELILIAGRPGQGKTTLALTILAEAVLRHRRAWFFTLEYTEAEAWRRLEGEGYSQSRLRPYLNIDASDDLSAKTMVDHMRPNVEEKPWLAVIDYLQIMDQNRQHPPLQQQVDMLKDFAREAGERSFCFHRWIVSLPRPTGRYRHGRISVCPIPWIYRYSTVFTPCMTVKSA